MKSWLPLKKWMFWFVFFFVSAFAKTSGSEPSPVFTAPPTQDLASADPLLLVSTLDGTLHAVSKRAGIVKWKLSEKPVLSVLMKSSSTIKGPTFLPDPRDGSLYVYDPSIHGLNKLSFTIPELVQASPCKSTDGILYTGKKQDVWYAINVLNGKKRQVITTEATSDKCPGGGTEDMYIGRSEYQVTMFDTKTNTMRWNVTFSDYSSHVNEKVAESYELIHLSSSTDGFVITVDRKSGQILWAQNYGYPVVAMYAWFPDGLQQVEMTTVAKETMDYLLRQSEDKVSFWDTMLQETSEFQPKEATLSPSLYIGQYQHGLYAFSAMIHNGVTFNMHRHLQSLPGPGNKERLKSTELEVANMTMPVWKIVGYHKLPPPPTTTLQSKDIAAYKPLMIDQVATMPEQLPKEDEQSVLPRMLHAHIANLRRNSYLRRRKLNHRSRPRAAQHPSPTSKYDIALVAVLTSLMTGLVIVGLLKRPLWPGGHPAPAPHDGYQHVGRISLNTNDILGRGSEGTVVYRGRFDGRDVAVKRVVPACFGVADREVELLKESDEHSHVIRYHCMERDAQFQYIALELCSNTLQEYVENPQYRCSTGLDSQSILRQAMMGLDHLHQLKIVHRDVKPTNILISVPRKLGVQRAVISDFGLCKKLVPGRVSFSHKSGAAGTDGWIAPEMTLDKQYRMTQAVDIFSMGCVFYYVLSGKHPFGNAIARQVRIVNGDHDLDELQFHENEEEARDLIRQMIVVDPSRRPNSDSVLAHPFFWDAVKKLQFFEDVSDRIEKDPIDSPAMKRLGGDSLMDIENGIPRDWVKHLCRPLQDDLQKFRSYKMGSVRDLLRAIRNKKHHYRELPDQVKQSLGTIPNEYLAYFTSKFPHLLIHTYMSMACCRKETVFNLYYGKSAKDHLFEATYGHDSVVEQSVITKPAMNRKVAWKNNKPSALANNESTFRKTPRLSKLASAADKDFDWRSNRSASSSSSASSNAFKSLLKHSSTNRHYANGQVGTRVFKPVKNSTSYSDKSRFRYDYMTTSDDVTDLPISESRLRSAVMTSVYHDGDVPKPKDSFHDANDVQTSVAEPDGGSELSNNIMNPVGDPPEEVVDVKQIKQCTPMSLEEIDPVIFIEAVQSLPAYDSNRLSQEEICDEEEFVRGENEDVSDAVDVGHNVRAESERSSEERTQETELNKKVKTKPKRRRFKKKKSSAVELTGVVS